MHLICKCEGACGMRRRKASSLIGPSVHVSSGRSSRSMAVRSCLVMEEHRLEPAVSATPRQLAKRALQNPSEA